MKVLIVGKKNLMRWPESVAKAMTSYVDTKLFLYNQKTGGYLLDKVLGAKKGKYVARRFEKTIAFFQPDLILFVSCFFMPDYLYRVLDKFPNIKKAGWAGDAFSANQKEKADKLDRLFCSDTGYLKATKEFSCVSEYLPLCADEDVFQNRSLPRTGMPLFYGVANEKRAEYLSASKNPILIYGKGWDKKKLAQHRVYNHKISLAQAATLVAKSVLPVNFLFSKNIINGLNFRVFEVSLGGGLILVNDCPDIHLCYEVGKEALVYRSPEEFGRMVEDIVAQPEKYADIAKAGYRRTIKEHTYRARVKTILEKMLDFKY